jgi:hypothetical protein
MSVLPRSAVDTTRDNRTLKIRNEKVATGFERPLLRLRLPADCPL